MAKKETQETNAEVVSPAVEERMPAVYQERDYTEEALAFLDEQQTIHEFGIINIKPNKGTTSFDCGSIGTLESPIDAIIIDMEPVRTLWPFGTEDVIKSVQEWSNRPICSSRNEYDANGKLIRTGCIKGKTIELDGSEPDQVRHLVEPPLSVNHSCNKCQWSEYESAFSGSGQACKEGRRLLLWLVEEKTFVSLLITPSGLKNWSQFDMGLQGKPFHSIVSAFSSIPMKKDNMTYSAVKVEIAKLGKEKRYTKKDDFMDMSSPILYNGANVPMVKAYVSKFRQLELSMEIDEDEFGSGDANF